MNIVEFPRPGEFVAMHLISDKKSKNHSLTRALYAGPQPWGKRGAKSGKCVDGRLIVNTPFSDDNFYRLLADIMFRVIHQNSPDSSVIEACGDIAIVVKQLGYSKGSAPAHCQRCNKRYERDEVSKSFSDRCRIEWMVDGEDCAFPRRVATLPCVSCFRICRDVVSKTGKDATDTNVETAIINSSTGQIDIAKMMTPGMFSEIVGGFQKFIDEIEG